MNQEMTQARDCRMGIITDRMERDGKAVRLCRASLTAKGWMERGSKDFPNADVAQALLPIVLVRS
jgi:hypothetical protein